MFEHRAIRKGPKTIIDDCGEVWIYSPTRQIIYMADDDSPGNEDTAQYEVYSHGGAIDRLIELGHLEAPEGWESPL